jgi:multiple sugar transport system substrate-binding protein
VVFKGPQAAAAKELARFMSQPASQAAFARSQHVLPGDVRAWEEPGVAGTPLLGALREALASPHPRAVFPGMARLFDALTPALQRVLRGELAPEEALGGVGAEWREIVGR